MSYRAADLDCRTKLRGRIPGWRWERVLSRMNPRAIFVASVLSPSGKYGVPAVTAVATP